MKRSHKLLLATLAISLILTFIYVKYYENYPDNTIGYSVYSSVTDMILSSSIPNYIRHFEPITNTIVFILLFIPINIIVFILLGVMMDINKRNQE